MASAFLWTTGVLALALGPVHQQAWLLKTFGDKAIHAAAFTFGCFFWGKTLEINPSLRRFAPLTAAAIALLFGLMIEWLQSYNPMRSTEAADIVADLVGILPAVLILWLGQRHHRDEVRASG